MKTKSTTTTSKSLLPILFLLFSFSLIAQKNEKPEITVYYFHMKTRCVTCQTVEAEAKKNAEQLFPGKVNFEVYNIEEPAGEAKGSELGVTGQSLIIVKGKKKIDITNQGFLYARINPEKFRSVMEDKIKPLL